jgi:hypothetical protein
MAFDNKTDWGADAVFIRGNTDLLVGAKQSFTQRIS